jgi:ABC-type transport system involved in multi-copper enzyme maturation permease subunit
LYLAGVFAILLMLAVVLLGEVSAGAENKISLDVGMAAIAIFGMIVAVFVGSALINKELEKKTALVLIAKPMSRAEFIVGKHLGLSAVLTVMVALMTVIFFAVMSFKQFQYPAGSLLVAVGFIALELSLIAAAAISFGVFTSSLIATLLTLAVYFMGHFSQNLVTLSKSIQNPAVQNIIQGIYLVFPDLSRLDLKNQAVYGILPDTAVLLANAAYGVLYIILLLSVSTWIFSTREF